MKFLKIFLVFVLIVSSVFVHSSFVLTREKVGTLNNTVSNPKTMLVLKENLSIVVGNQELVFKVILFFPGMRFWLFPYQINRV